MPWEHGFDAVAVASEEDVFQFTATFPGLGKVYVHMLPKLGSMISTVLEVQETMAARVVTATGVPSVKLLGSRDMALPTHIKLLVLEGKPPKRQRVVYASFPNQCFVCHKMGHMAQECVDKNDWSTT